MQRVLVIATRQIGDVLLTTPLIHAARQRWPQAHIDVIGFAGTLGMLRGNPDVHQLIETPASFGWASLRRFAATYWRRYDLALVALGSDRAHLVAWITAKRRVGILPQRHGSNWWKRRLLEHVVWSGGDDSQEHVVSEKLRLLDPWPGAGLSARVVPPPAAALPARFQAQLEAGAVVLHAPSMWPYKQWDPARFRVLARALVARGHQIVVTGTGGARDQACTAALRELAAGGHVLDATGQLDFNQLAGLLAQSALYIGPDTSVSHLAAAAGVRTLAIFGPTNPQRWGPWPATASGTVRFQRRALDQAQGNVTLLQAGLPCVPCSRAGCHDHLHSHSDCLDVIAADRVLERALALLAEPAGVHR
ncbi:MAG: glycosyltransferase family 9 protein [Ramlibacter sp.]